MNEVLRSRLQTLSSAYAQGKLEFVTNFIDKDIDFISYAPVSVFPCLGKQRGKAAVEKSLETIHAHFEFHAYKPILMVVEANDAAVIIQARATQRATGASFSSCLRNSCDFGTATLLSYVSSWTRLTPSSRCSAAK